MITYGPSTGLEFVVLPAVSVIRAGELLSGNVSVELNHCSLHHADVFVVGQSAETSGNVTRRVRGQNNTGTGAVDLVAGVANTADTGNATARAAAADDGVLEVLPETSRSGVRPCRKGRTRVC